MIQHQGRQLQVGLSSLQYNPVDVQTERSATSSCDHQIQHTRECQLLTKEREGLVDELLALKHAMK